MLFNSFEFILLFLPAVVVFYRFLELRNVHAALWLLAAASLFFYGWWSPPHVLLLLGSVVGNFVLGRAVAAAPHSSRARALFVLGLVANLATLGWFKYAYFASDLFQALTGERFDVGVIILPLAISFFTFQQVSFLIDARRGDIGNLDFLTYVCFVCFFPQLIAGPIVRYDEIVPQFRARIRCGAPESSRYWRDLYVGLSIFGFGLVKKVILADNFALLTDPAFAMTAAAQDPTMITAWVAALAFSFQIYFDFSGYSDMAIGLAKMMGYRLPVNFLAPYKSTNIADFWRRWHITLSRFLRDSLYIPLGGNQHGRSRQYFNLFIVMALGGLWHGAAWTFVIWGILHGCFLLIHRTWRFLTGGRVSIGRVPSIGVTFLAVTFAWVIFRSPSLDAALLFYENMISPSKLVLPSATAVPLGSLASALEGIGLQFGTVPEWRGTHALVLLAIGAAICFAAPSLLEVFRRYRPTLEPILPLSSRPGFWARSVSMAALGLLCSAWALAYFQANETALAAVPTPVTASLVVLCVLTLLAMPQRTLAFEWRATSATPIATAGALLLVLGGLFLTGGDAFIYFAF